MCLPRNRLVIVKGEMKKRKLGYLSLCADRRFWLATVGKFEELTGLSSEQGDFWIEAKAGGTPGINDPTTADYAYEHSARFMGWQAHGDSCGGYPGLANEEIQEILEEIIKERIKRYPKARHFRVFATKKGVEGKAL